MYIDVYQDIVCPWCRIGKKNLEDALRQWSRQHDEEVTVAYHAFQLDPDLPSEGRDFSEAMAVKMGGASNVSRVTGHVTKSGVAVGVSFRFDLMTRMPNTFLAHRLIALVEADKKAEIIDALFQAYFEEGRDIARLEEIIRTAQRAGLDGTEMRKRLEHGEGAEAVSADLESARSIGVSGVPFFVFNNKYALSGAYPAAEFIGLLERLKHGP